MARTDLHIPELKDKFVDYRDPIWGDSYSWAWERRTDEIRYLVIHHSVTSHEATADDIALLHKARGWGGIGYHLVITKDGKVWYVGDVSTARANVADMNEKVIGICMIGDFTKHLPSDEQIVSCHLLSNFFLEQPNWPNLKDWSDVVGHKELSATSCPGSSWDKTQDGDMWWRVKTGTPYTPPTKEEIVEEAKGDGQEVTIKGYKDFVDDLIQVMKLPVDQSDFASITGKAQELMTIASKVKDERENHENFVKDVAKGIGCAEVSEKAVLEALLAPQAEISRIKQQRLEEFGAFERIWSGLKALIPKRG